MTQWTAAEMGRKGGKKSRRVLTTEQARAMVEAREKKRLHKNIDSDAQKTCGHCYWNTGDRVCCAAPMHQGCSNWKKKDGHHRKEGGNGER